MNNFLEQVPDDIQIKTNTILNNFLDYLDLRCKNSLEFKKQIDGPDYVCADIVCEKHKVAEIIVQQNYYKFNLEIIKV